MSGVSQHIEQMELILRRLKHGLESPTLLEKFRTHMQAVTRERVGTGTQFTRAYLDLGEALDAFEKTPGPPRFADLRTMFEAYRGAVEGGGE
jgi:hypothetical protein